tara:strand:+ start:212 stop:811 length:600 start_codon:yes stop_codon:yes gene_type:complete
MSQDKNYIFTEKQYKSDYGFITYVWGPMLWHFLHILSFNYPVNPEEYNKKNNYCRGFIQNIYYLFIRILQYLLPCKSCRDNLVNNLNVLYFKENKTQIMANRESFSRFIYNLHETVNKMLKKDSNLSYKDVRDFYEHFRAYCSNKDIKGNKIHSGCIDLEHNGQNRVKPKVIIYFVPFSKKLKTTKIHKKCGIKCCHNN